MFPCKVALCLVIGIGAASAQTGEPDETVGVAPPVLRLELSPPQRTAILDAVKAGAKQGAADTELHPTVGAQVPASMELHVIPDRALVQAPDAKGLNYVVVRNQVLLVDPATLRVVDVIDR